MHDLIHVSDEVQAALEEERAVVALETTLVAHGFPAPDGVETGLASEAAVRAAGAVPATDRRARRAGPDRARAGRSSSGSRPRPASSGHATSPSARSRARSARRPSAARSTAAAAVGIRFMGTGGLGGVHRGFPPARRLRRPRRGRRIPALVASSGVKSLLDVPATVELLETLGVPVIGYRTDTLPLFYDAAGGPPVSARADDVERDRTHRRRPLAPRRERAARRPPAVGEPRRGAADRGGGRRGRARRRRGQAVTPFVLAYLHEHSDGETRRVNRDLIVANAGLAGAIAAAYAALVRRLQR